MNDQTDSAGTDERLADAVGAHLRAAADSLDAAMLSKLNQARQAALAAMPTRRSRRAQWLGAAVTAAVAMLAIGLWRADQPGQVAEQPVAAAPADMALLLGDEPLAMIEDLEFFAWLAAADLDAGAPG